MLPLFPTTKFNKYKVNAQLRFQILTAFTSPLYLFCSRDVLMGDLLAALLTLFV